MSGGTIKVSAWSPPHAARLYETSRKDPLKSCSTTSAFGADADDLIALIAGITLNLLMAFNRMLKKGFQTRPSQEAMKETQ